MSKKSPTKNKEIDTLRNLRANRQVSPTTHNETWRAEGGDSPTLMYSLRTAILNEHAHVADFWPVLPVITCSFARLPCLVHGKLKKIKGTQNVARVVANLA